MSQLTLTGAGASAGGGEAAWWLSGGISAVNCIAAYQPKGPADYAASKVNLNQPGTYDAVDGSAYPTWASATGWTFVGTSSQYLSTGIMLQAGYCMIVQYSGATMSSVVIAGHYNMNQRFELRPVSEDTNVGYGYGNATIVNKAPELTAGNLCLTPTSGYRNGTSEQALTGTWAGTASYALTIGGRRRSDAGGSVDSHFTGSITAVAIYSTALSAGQVAAVSAAMAAL